MMYAPQSWLADWSAAADVFERIREKERMDYYDKPFYDYPDDGSELPKGLSWRVCADCGKRFVGKGAMKLCRQCRREHFMRGVKRYNQKGKFSSDARADDVPDVPSDEALYYSEADKAKKTAPIKTVLVPKKEDAEMDLSKFPSLSNRTEHPENFTGTSPEFFNQPADTSVPAAESVTIHMDGTDGIAPDEKLVVDALKEAHNSLLKEITSDKKRMLLSLYDGMCDLCNASDMTFAEMLDRMSRLHAALN